MATTDPIMDKIRKDQRRMAWRIWPSLACLTVLIGALSFFVGWELAR